eukprot:m.62777 g.62777  ORF g.62777 m.62777 type:complete len:52 (-) comp19399_c0_seq1:65-220(-)
MLAGWEIEPETKGLEGLEHMKKLVRADPAAAPSAVKVTDLLQVRSIASVSI